MVVAGSLQLPGVVVTPLASDSDPPSLPDLQPETETESQRDRETGQRGRQDELPDLLPDLLRRETLKRGCCRTSCETCP